MTNSQDFTENPVAWKAMHDRVGREKKAEKIISVIKDYHGDVSELSLIDLSCSTGYMAKRFGDEFKKVVGIDVDEHAVSFAQAQSHSSNVEFIKMDALNIEFDDESFDIAICNQMYEHVSNAKLLMAEIYRILKPSGICYFGAGNRLTPIDPHYGKLPLISWLPKPVANFYLHILGKGDTYDVNFKTFWTLNKIVSNFERIDFTDLVVKDPVKYNALDLIKPNSIKQRLSLFILKYLYWIFPGYIWLLKKPESQ